MVTALTCPMMSVNWSWTKRIPRSVAASISGIGVLLVVISPSVLEQQLAILG